MELSNSRVILLVGGDHRSRYADGLREAGLAVLETEHSPTIREVLQTIRPEVVIASFDPNTREQCLALCQEVNGNEPRAATPILLTAGDVSDGDVSLLTRLGVLIVSLHHGDVTKLVAAVKGVLAAHRAGPLPGSLQSPSDMPRSA